MDNTESKFTSKQVPVSEAAVKPARSGFEEFTVLSPESLRLVGGGEGASVV